MDVVLLSTFYHDFFVKIRALANKDPNGNDSWHHYVCTVQFVRTKAYVVGESKVLLYGIFESLLFYLTECDL